MVSAQPFTITMYTIKIRVIALTTTLTLHSEVVMQEKLYCQAENAKLVQLVHICSPLPLRLHLVIHAKALIQHVLEDQKYTHSKDIGEVQTLRATSFHVEMM